MKYCCNKFQGHLKYTIRKEHDFFIDAEVGDGYSEKVILKYCPFCGTELKSNKLDKEE